MILAFIVLAVVLVLMIKGLSDPFMALLAFVTVYELQPGELYPALNVLHLERVLLVYIVVVFLANRLRLRFPSVTKKMLLFYGAMLAATPFAFWISNSLRFDFKFLEIVIYHLLLVAMLDSEERIRKYLLLFIGLTGWIGGTALYEYHIGVRQFAMGIDRAEGLTSSGGDPNSLATTMIISLPLAFLLLSKGNSKWIKFYGLSIILIYIVTIVDTGSRTGFLALILFFFLTVFHKKRNWKLLPVLLVLLPLMWLVIPEQYKVRYESIKTRDQDESYTDRLLSWQGGIRMFLHNPVTGVGPNNYTDANGEKYWPVYPRVWLNAHSCYFKLLGELGILGVITFFTYTISVMRLNYVLSRRFRKEKMDPIVRQLPQACILAFIILFFTGYSGHNTYRPTWYTLGGVTAAMALLKRKEQAEEPGLMLTARRVPAWVPSGKSRESETVGAR